MEEQTKLNREIGEKSWKREREYVREGEMREAETTMNKSGDVFFFYSAVLFLRKGANDGDIKRTKKEDWGILRHPKT